MLNYGSGDMFIPKSILKMLLRGIAWYINDPKTYRTYALVHSITAAAAREFRLPKQKEFTIILGTSNTSYIPTPILPNGVPHGICSDGDKILYLFNYGEFIMFDRCNIKSNNYKQFVRFTKNFRILRTIYSYTYTSVQISLILNTNRYIEGYICKYCDKIHIIRFQIINKTVYLVSKCYESASFIKTSYYLFELQHIYYKPSLRSRVVKYARSLK
jgi:hypothetical protein